MLMISTYSFVVPNPQIDLHFCSQIVRVELQGAAAFLYCRLVPLILLLVEGK
jgi:hypothetical protein